jgi:MraZ protein
VSSDVSEFVGTFTPRLDEKSRLFLPAKFRPQLEGGVMLSRGQEKCIYGWTLDSWSAFTARVREAPITNARVRKFARLLGSGASREMPDKQGRVTIPAVLRTYASIERDVTVIGALNRFEIWDTARWEEFSEAGEDDFSDVDEEGIFTF